MIKKGAKWQRGKGTKEKNKDIEIATKTQRHEEEQFKEKPSKNYHQGHREKNTKSNNKTTNTEKNNGSPPKTCGDDVPKTRDKITSLRTPIIKKRKKSGRGAKAQKKNKKDKAYLLILWHACCFIIGCFLVYILSNYIRTMIIKNENYTHLNKKHNVKQVGFKRLNYGLYKK